MCPGRGWLVLGLSLQVSPAVRTYLGLLFWEFIPRMLQACSASTSSEVSTCHAEGMLLESKALGLLAGAAPGGP